MATKRKDAIDLIEWMRNLLAFLLIGAFIGAMAAFTLLPVPDENKDILTYMIGQLSGMAITVLSFYFVNKVGQDAIDAKRTDNTSKLADAVTTALKTAPPNGGVDIEEAVDAVAEAAENEANTQKGG